MVGGTQSKPSRSEVEALDSERQIMIEETVRRKFEEEAPKRAPKPERSEPGDVHQELSCTGEGVIPEYIKFQHLEATSPIEGIYAGDVMDEFTETEYYKSLNAVEKSLHHTTGSGFIRVDNVADFTLASNGNGLPRTRFQCNPARNDWSPSLDSVLHSSSSSSKPPRSDP